MTDINKTIYDVALYGAIGIGAIAIGSYLLHPPAHYTQYGVTWDEYTDTYTRTGDLVDMPTGISADQPIF